MKPHPRIRQTIKWGGAAVTVLLLMVWIGSGWWQMGWRRVGWPHVVVTEGQLRLDDDSRSFQAVLSPGFRFEKGGGSLKWQFQRKSDLWAWERWFPLWPPVAAYLFVTAVSWRLDTLAHRRAKLNLCPKCNYDRTGLVSDAECPECGAVPAGV